MKDNVWISQNSTKYLSKSIKLSYVNLGTSQIVDFLGPKRIRLDTILIKCINPVRKSLLWISKKVAKL